MDPKWRARNAASWARKFTSRWIEPGLISYEDIGHGRALLKKETIDKHMESFVGKPLVIKHNAISRDTGKSVGDPKPSNLDEVAVGYLTRVWYNAQDGWYWCEGVVFDDDAKNLISNSNGKAQVSCAYKPVGVAGPAGTWHSMKYNYEIAGFEGEHLAIEANPRYKGANIFLNAESKPKTHPVMFKLFAKKPDATAAQVAEKLRLANEALTNAIAEGAELPEDMAIQINDAGETKTLGELVANATVENAMTEIDPEMEVEYAAGKKAKMNAIMKHYANAMDEMEKKDEADKMAKNGKKKNAEGAVVDMTPAERKAAGLPVDGKVAPVARLSHYAKLTNAQELARNAAPKGTPESSNSREARIARGNKRWGAPPKPGDN